MATVTVDELQIRVSGSSTNAYAAVDALIGALEKLQHIRIDSSIAKEIDNIGKSASKAASKVSKMAGAFVSAASGMNQYAMTLKNFAWEFGDINKVFRSEPFPFKQIGTEFANMGGTEDIIDAFYWDATPLIGMAHDTVTAIDEVTESARVASDETMMLWRHNAEVLQGLSGSERSQGIKDAFAAFTDADWAKYNPSFAFFNSIENGFEHLKVKAKEASKSMNTFFKSISRIATYRLIRSALKAITSGLREGVQNLAQYSKAIGQTDTFAANTVMSEYATKLLEVKNAVGSAVMPVLAALQPVIMSIANAFIIATNAINAFFSAIGGKGTYTKAQSAAVDYAATLDSSSAGANKAAKQLSAGFDELNVLSDSQSAGGGGGASSGMPAYTDMFSEATIPSWITDNLQLIKDLVEAIALGLLAWKIASLFTDDLSKIAGIAMAIVGAFLLVKGAIDAWTNGVNWTNVLEMIGGAALLAGGLAIAFGAVGAAIGLLVGGVAMLVIGIRDWIKTGELSTETFTLLEAGIVAVGVGLALLLGWIPLVVAAVVGLGLAIYMYWDEIVAFLTTAWENFKIGWQATCEEVGALTRQIWDSITTYFAGVWETIKTVAVIAWTAIKTFFVTFIPTIITAIVNFFGQLAGKIKLKFDMVKNTIIQWVADVKSWVNTNLPAAINTIVDWFAKIPSALVNVGKNMIKALWNGILSMGNWLWDKIVGFLGDLGEFASEIFGSFGSGTEEALDDIPKFASGGVVSSGQMFIARENGAELVGSVGGSTAVMNNDQIVSAVSSGVYSAVVSAMGQNNGDKAIYVYLDGKQIEASTRTTKQRRGASIATGGVINYA